MAKKTAGTRKSPAKPAKTAGKIQTAKRLVETGGAADAATDTGPEGGRSAGSGWVWRDFFRYGAVAVLAVWLGVSIAGCGARAWSQYRAFREWQKQNFSDNEDNSFHGSDQNGKTLERWIRANLPAEGAAQYGAVADVFANVAAKLRAGTLAGPRSACAETIALLQPVIDRRVWEKFLRELYKRAVKEAGNSGEELAALWERIAGAIRGTKNSLAEGIAEGVLGVTSPALSPPDPDTGEAVAEQGEEAEPEAEEAETVPEEEPAAEEGTSEGSKDAPAGGEAAADDAEPEKTAEAGDCPTGTCPNRGAYGYGSGYGYGYGWRYW